MRIVVALVAVAALFLAPAAAAEQVSADDPTGDTSPPGGEGRHADILGYSLDVTATELSVSATLAAELPEYPLGISVRWELEVRGRTVAYAALSSLGDSVGGGAVTLPVNTRADAERCGGEASVEGRVATVERIPIGCLGGEFSDVRVRVDASYVARHSDEAPDGGGPSASIAAQPRTGSREALRVSGGDRFATAVAASRLRTPDPRGGGTVHIASATEAADALAVGNSFRRVLLVPPCDELPPIVAEELARLSPSEVTAIGGPAAVCDATLDDAAAVSGAARDRLAGADRYSTSAGVVAAYDDACEDSADCPPTGDLYLARGDDFADALAAAPLDAGPILLVPPCGELGEASRVALDRARFRVQRIVVLGGDRAVCDDVIRQVRQALQREDLPALRLFGNDRVGTAIEISKERYPAGAVEVALARGDAFPDALAAGSLPQGPVLLLPEPCTLPEDVAEEIARLNPTTVFALGGPSAVCDSVLEAARR